MTTPVSLNVSFVRLCLTSLLLLVFALMLQSCSDSGSSSGGPPQANGFNRLLGETFKHPRCINCHGFRERNPVGERHRAQGRPENCTICHKVPTWDAPVSSFSFDRLSTEDICRAVKNKFAGNVQRLRQHLVTSPRNRWGLEQGLVPNGDRLPTAPPGSMTAFTSNIDRWIAAGAVCD